MIWVTWFLVGAALGFLAFAGLSLLGVLYVMRHPEKIAPKVMPMVMRGMNSGGRKQRDRAYRANGK
jgi:hypothetical protein